MSDRCCPSGEAIRNPLDVALISVGAVRENESTYALVADADPHRAAACLESIRPFNLGVVIARDGGEAIRVVQRLGPPVLLIVDLSLPGNGGFTVIEALRELDRARAQIIAWSSSRELREFATQRLAGLNVRILGGTVAPAVVRGAIELGLGSAALATPGPNAGAAASDVHQAMTALSEQARRVCATPGVAVYLRASGETHFRAAVSWTSDEPTPQSPSQLPQVFRSIIETGKPLLLPDLVVEPTSTLHDGVRGLAAVPIVSTDQQVIGAICVFDLKPLTLSGAQLAALEGLGRGALVRPADTGARGFEATASPPDNEVTSPASDSSTAVMDRLGGSFAIRRELARARREQRQLSIVLFDVAEVGGTTGGATREPVPDLLGPAGKILMTAVRESDLAIRWSRNELLLVLTGLSVTEARSVAERVRAVVQAAATHRVAVAGGVAELLADEPFDAVLARATEKLRLARERGHNRVA